MNVKPKRSISMNTVSFNPSYIPIITHSTKKLEENIVEKGEIAQNERFYLFPQCFQCNFYLKIL